MTAAGAHGIAWIVRLCAPPNLSIERRYQVHKEPVCGPMVPVGSDRAHPPKSGTCHGSGETGHKPETNSANKSGNNQAPPARQQGPAGQRCKQMLHEGRTIPHQTREPDQVSGRRSLRSSELDHRTRPSENVHQRQQGSSEGVLYDRGRAPARPGGVLTDGGITTYRPRMRGGFQAQGFVHSRS